MANDRHLLTDFRLELRQQQFRPVYRAATTARPGPAGLGLLEDLDAVSGRDNLRQAIILRLLTPRGELAALGHPDYGSRLPELIGRANNGTTRNLVKLHILECLQRESRLQPDGTQADVVPTPGQRDSVDVTLQVTPANTSDRVTIGPINLELGP